MTQDIIWDLDGTLIDSLPDIAFHLSRAVELVGLPISEQVVPFRIGPPLTQVILGSYPNATITQIEQISCHYRQYYDNSAFEHTVPFEGIEDLLHLLATKGVRHHIVTNKPAFATSNVLTKLGWKSGSFFSSVRSPYINKQGETVKKAELMSEVLIEFGADPRKTISIGDMVGDAMAAHENKIYRIGVTWGTGCSEELLPVCDQVAGTVHALRTHLIR